MSATPTYDAVVEDLKIDPARIAARPAWSFEIAERVRKHRKRVLRSAAAKVREQEAAAAKAAGEVPSQRGTTRTVSSTKQAGTTRKTATRKSVPRQTRSAKQTTKRATPTKRAAAAK